MLLCLLDWDCAAASLAMTCLYDGAEERNRRWSARREKKRTEEKVQVGSYSPIGQKAEEQKVLASLK